MLAPVAQTLDSAMNEFLSSDIEIYRVDTFKRWIVLCMDESLTSDTEIYQKPPKSHKVRYE